MANDISVTFSSSDPIEVTFQGANNLTAAQIEALLDAYYGSAAWRTSGAITSVFGRTGAVVAVSGDYDESEIANKVEYIVIACSDETTDLTAGTAKASFRMPFAATITDVRAEVNTAPTGSTLIVDINDSGTTILSTKLSIDAGEKTSETAATPPVISDSSIAENAIVSIDIDQVGSSTAGAGLKVTLICTR